MKKLFDEQGKELSPEEVLGLYDFFDITRIEVIDEQGRSYVNKDRGNSVTLSLQDDGKTLKVFISKKYV